MYAHGGSRRPQPLSNDSLHPVESLASPHIPQPPHSAGLSYQGLRPRIAPNQVPSPLDAIEIDRDLWASNTFMTLPGQHVPLSTTDFVAIDQGNSSPKHMRMTTWNVPSTSRLARECEVPIAAIIQPFAELDAREEEVPLVDFGETGPPRCAKCRAYVNAWCKWVNGGSSWRCNLCEHETPVIPEYFCNIDANSLRLDHLQRPELNKGTVDFAVTPEYWATTPPPRLVPSFISIEPIEAGPRPPKTLNYVFIIDVSMQSVQSGFLAAACQSLQTSLFGAEGEEACWDSNCQICIITFDRSLHFYNLNDQSGHAPMLVTPDIEEIFLPIREGLFVDPSPNQIVIEDLLAALPNRYQHSFVAEAALGPALRAGLCALAGRGGQIVAFQSVLPTIGAGALEPRSNESDLYDTEKEKTLFTPRDPIWQDIGEECADHGVSVTIFLAPNNPTDVGSIGTVSSMTGGDIFFHPRFDAIRDSLVLNSQLRRLLKRATVYDCMMRVRSSTGLRIVSHHGNFHQHSTTDLAFGTLDADKALSVTLEHSRALDARQYVCLQSAVLYTTKDGQRRVRVCNLALQVATLAGDVYRYADMDATVTHIVRESVVSMKTMQLKHIREDLTEKCSSILLGYRRNCAGNTATSQLILPEAFKTLPAYVLAIIKSKPIKGRNVTSDVRNYAAHRFLSMSVRGTMQSLYPPLMAIHDLDDSIALPHPETGVIEIPTLMRNSHIYMEAHGVYLIDNEEMTIIWVGNSVSPQLLIDLFGVDDIFNVDSKMVELPSLPSRISNQVRNILAYRQIQRGRILKFFVVRQNMDGLEIEFSDMLVEDQNNAAMAYIDYLCTVHSQITAALKHGGPVVAASSMRSPW